MLTQAVVFDFGGVLFDWNPEYLYGELIPEPQTRQQFLSEITDWIVEQDAGKSIVQATEEWVVRYPQYASYIRAFHQRWSDMLRGTLPEGMALFNALHNAGVPLYGLTNWSAETFPYAWENYPFLQRFRHIVVSGRERVAKPNPAIYQIMQQHIVRDIPTITPQQIVYIDDNLKNVHAAREHGWQAIHHSDARHTRQQLQALGLPL